MSIEISSIGRGKPKKVLCVLTRYLSRENRLYTRTLPKYLHTHIEKKR